MSPAPLNSPSKRRWLGRALLWSGLLTLAVLGGLVAERGRGRSALHAWQQERLAHGESLDPTRLWPKPDESAQDFSRRLKDAAQSFSPALKEFSGRMSGLVPTEPGWARRGSQEPQPPGLATNQWRQLEVAVQQNAVALDNLRRLMNKAPASLGDDILQRIQTDGSQYSWGTRGSAQILHAVVLHDLHRGSRESALTNLLALTSFARLHADEPTLLIFMLRVAVIGLSIDACWDALQAPGWTEAELARLHQAVQLPFLDRMPRVLEAERAARSVSWAWFRSHSYETWLHRYADLYRSFGLIPPQHRTGSARRLWHEWAFHPVWRFAWADQEELGYLQHTQRELDAVRRAVNRGSWRGLDQHLQAMERDYQPPIASWRFHGGLPFIDEVPVLIGRPPSSAYPYPFYRKAWQVTFQHLTQQELVVTAIALKRHALRHGQLPATLEALVPAFLPAAPRDLMDGHSLRYRLNSDGTFLLYSVGPDCRDDGGDPIPDTSGSPAHAWNGRDWTWPRLAPAARPSA